MKKTTVDISNKNSISNVIIHVYPKIDKNITTTAQLVNLLNDEVSKLGYLNHGIKESTWNSFIDNVKNKNFNNALITIGSYQLAGNGMKVF